MQGPPPPSESDLQTAESTLEGLRSRKRAFEEQGGAERAAAPPPDAQHEGWLLQETPSSANDWERRFVEARRSVRGPKRLITRVWGKDGFQNFPPIQEIH